MSEPLEKIAPVQGYAAGIPWSMHLRAYDAYCKKYGPQPALIDLEKRNCRGGFGTSELDMFIPGWREELEEFHQLRADLTRHKAALKVAMDALEESGRTIATMRKLAPEKARPSVLMPDGREVTHREMCSITQEQIADALTQIEKELKP